MNDLSYISTKTLFVAIHYNVEIVQSRQLIKMTMSSDSHTQYLKQNDEFH